MRRQCVVYKIENRVNKKKYIGKTHCPERRWSAHCYEADRGTQSILYRAMRKYGSHNFSFIIMSTHATDESALKEEVRSIRANRTLFPSGYNLTLGGDGITGAKIGPHNNEWNNKIRVANTGKKHTDRTKRKIAAANIGRRVLKETRDKMKRSSLRAVILKYLTYGTSYGCTGRPSPMKGKKVCPTIRRRVSNGVRKNWSVRRKTYGPSGRNTQSCK